MKYIDQHAELISEKNPYKKIELAGRTCYKSESKITEDSATQFTRGLIKRGHTAMVEHCFFAFRIETRDNVNARTSYLEMLYKDPFIQVTENIGDPFKEEYRGSRIIVSGNLRAICERGLNDPIYRALKANYPDLVYGVSDFAKKLFPSVKAYILDLDAVPDLSDVELATHKTMTFKLTTNRGVSHEIVRHRLASFAQESTRYVNYKTGISIVLPADLDEKSETVQQEYTDAFMDAEKHYQRLIEAGETPQQARAVLPIGLKTELVITARLYEWAHIFNLRLFGTTGKPHPETQEIMKMVYEQACNDGKVKSFLVRYLKS